MNYKGFERTKCSQVYKETKQTVQNSQVKHY